MQKIPVDLPVLHEDENYIVIDKPSGLLVQPKDSKDLEYTVLDYIKPLTTDSDIDRPGIVHRLDRGTSGVMLLAKSKEAREHAQEQFADRNVKKTYIAICSGKPKDKEFLIDLPIQRNPKMPACFRVNPSGKTAQTIVRVLKSNEQNSLLELLPKTGRTHQIRVHLQYIGCPILNDPFYSKEKPTNNEKRLMLHAKNLEIKLFDKLYNFSSEAPKEFLDEF